jgi:hypothetical protein
LKVLASEADVVPADNLIIRRHRHPCGDVACCGGGEVPPCLHSSQEQRKNVGRVIPAVHVTVTLTLTLKSCPEIVTIFDLEKDPRINSSHTQYQSSKSKPDRLFCDSPVLDSIQPDLVPLGLPSP